MISKKVVALCATVGVAFSGFALAVPAHADPVSESYSIVGSDTLEDVVGSLIQGTSITGSPVRSLVNNAASGSFDATGTPYIITKTSGIRFGRPNGSGDGRKAMLASIDGVTAFNASAQRYPSTTAGSVAYPVVPGSSIAGTVDLSRASSSGTASTNGVLVQIPFGRDAISYVYDSASVAGIENLTIAQLKQVFEGQTPLVINGTTINAVTPQTGSGTGKDWAKMIGASTTLENAAAVVAGGTVSFGQEHDASTLAVNTIMPMSASRWIAMHDGGSYPKFLPTSLMASIEGVSAVTGTGGTYSVTTGIVTGSTLAPNATYYNMATNGTNFGRDTYIVAEYARITPGNGAYDANLANLVDPTLSQSLTNTSTSNPSKAGSVKLKFGFLAPLGTTSVRISG